MKYFLSVILALPFYAHAQSKLISQVSDFEYYQTQKSTYENAILRERNEVFPDLPDGFSLELSITTQSLSGTHEHYHVHYLGIEIVNAFVLIHRFANKTEVVVQIPETTETATQAQDVWIINRYGELIGATTDTTASDLGIDEVNYTTAEGETHILQGTYNGNASGSGFVFLPDPLTTANASYSGQFTDNNDATNAALDNQRVQVNLEVTENNGIYRLENDYVRIAEHSPPTILPVTSTTGDFLYNRSESGFEDVNAFYHITEFQKYIQNLGITSLANYQLPVDVHGLNGQDQSVFQWGPEQVTFGDGGVDDAEDADVILHEYGHALSYDAAPNTNFGMERRAIDEGLADFLAVSYSRLHEEYEWYNVFNWDGHNEFWPGRIAISDAKYPIDLSNDLYDDAPLWSASLMQVEENISRDETHRILFESMYTWFSGMTMTDAANAFIQADSQLNGGANYAYIGHVFYERGFIDTVYIGRPSDLVLSTSEHQKKHAPVVFSFPNPVEASDEIFIESSSEGNIFIYDLNGRLIHSSKLFTGSNTLRCENLNGLHLLTVSTSKGDVFTEKVLFKP